MMETVSIPYFRELLAKHLTEFETSIHTWEKLSSSENVPEDVLDEIRCTVGLTNLLMKQKMKQFGELIEDCENKRGEKEITCVDLQGFWDMVYHEIEKIQKSFLKLEKCQKNNWTFIEDPMPKVETKKKENIILNPKVENAAKERAIAAQQRLAEAKLKMKSKLTKKIEEPIKALIEKPDTPIDNQTKEVGQNEDEKEESPRKRSKRMELNVLNTKPRNGLTQTEDSDKKNIIETGQVSSSKKKDKENSLPVSKKDASKFTPSTPNEKASAGSTAHSKRTPRETIPLQCMTRSAKKALLAKENALKGK